MNQSNLCFFDVETTGLHAIKERLVSLAFVVTSSTGKELQRYHEIIKPDGFTIDEKGHAFRIHRITNRRANRDGKDLHSVLMDFTKMLDRHKPILISHLLRFDKGFIKHELIRMGLFDLGYKVEKWKGFCTAEGTKTILNKRKKVKLQELYKHCFEMELTGHHDALVDSVAVMDCFFHLKSRGYQFV